MSFKGKICGFCGEAHPFPAENDNGVPKTFPPFRVHQDLRLNPAVFTARFPKVPAEQNVFVIAGPLADGLCRRTMHCAVKFDRALSVHRYQIEVRWTGCAGDISTQRKIMVWADDVSAAEEGE